MSDESANEFRPNVDIDTLINRIREKVSRQKQAVVQPILKPHSGGASARIGLKELDTSQADFNQALVYSLDLITEELSRMRTGLNSLNRRLDENAEKDEERDHLTSEQIKILSESLGKAGKQITHSLSQSKALDARIDSICEGQSALEQRIYEKIKGELGDEIRKEFQQNFQAANQQLSEMSASIYGLDQRINNAIADFGQKMDEMIDGVRRDLQTERATFEHQVLEGGELAARSIGQSLAERYDDLSARFDDLWRRVAALDAHPELLDGKLGHLRDELKMRLLRVERIVKGLTNGAPEKAADTQHIGSESKTLKPAPESVVSSNGSKMSPPPFDYFMFEHSNRGSISDIKRRQSKYLDLFMGRHDVLDLGCGRGEFVELLSENGINVTGVDQNPDMVQFCHDRGLTVVEADMFDYLESLPDASLDAVFSAQVVEHLAPEQIVRLVQLCGQKLRSHGVMVAETVNTNCPEALANFYLDPTHVRPVPAKMLRFIFEQAAFKFKGWKFSAPVGGSGADEAIDVAGDLPKEIGLYQDYAAIAVRN